MNWVENFLKHAAHDELGKPVFGRVQGRTGQWFVTPLDPSGSPVALWTKSDDRQGDDGFRDEDGNVLMGAVWLYDDSVSATALDASLRPIISLVVHRTRDGRVMSPNPGGWPLTEEELDRTEPIPDPPEGPDWEREAKSKAARDDLGQLLTTRVRAADGEWTDVLMTRDGKPLRFELDMGIAAGRAPTGEQKTFTLMRTPRGLVAITLDAAGSPTQSAAGVAKLLADSNGPA